jgi:type III secretory pathway component EscS
MVAYLSAISLPDFWIVLIAALETILVADIVLVIVEIRMEFSFEFLIENRLRL